MHPVRIIPIGEPEHALCTKRKRCECLPAQLTKRRVAVSLERNRVKVIPERNVVSERRVADCHEILPIPISRVERVRKRRRGEWRRIANFEPRVMIKAQHLRVERCYVRVNITLVTRRPWSPFSIHPVIRQKVGKRKGGLCRPRCFNRFPKPCEQREHRRPGWLVRQLKPPEVWRRAVQHG